MTPTSFPIYSSFTTPASFSSFSSRSLYSFSPYGTTSIFTRPDACKGNSQPSCVTYSGIPRPLLYLQHLEEVWGTSITETHLTDMDLELKTRCNAFPVCREFHEESLVLASNLMNLNEMNSKSKRKLNTSLLFNSFKNKKEMFCKWTSKLTLSPLKKKGKLLSVSPPTMVDTKKKVRFQEKNKVLVFSIVDEIMYDLGIDLSRYREETEWMNDVDMEMENLMDAILESAFLERRKKELDTTSTLKTTSSSSLNVASPKKPTSILTHSSSILKNNSKANPKQQTSTSSVFKWRMPTSIVSLGSKSNLLKKDFRQGPVVDSKGSMSHFSLEDPFLGNSQGPSDIQSSTPTSTFIPVHSPKHSVLTKMSKSIKHFFSTRAVRK
ncbi:hypothetical protein HMI54_006692 [Coelomomyces lativittatus]|nr:hypothetical protein HMI54_006692 [Coelomomyces lativittatus]